VEESELANLGGGMQERLCQYIATPAAISRISRWIYHFLVYVAVCTCAVTAHAQYRASIRGVVTDPQGSIIPGAIVTLTNTENNQKQVSVSDSNGIYNFNALPPARFSITVEKEGFKKKVLEQVQIIPEQLNSINLQMELGQVQQTVTVAGTTQGLDAETATVSSTISSNQIQHLPSFNRDVFQLAQLTPGVFGDSSQASGGGAFNLPGNQGPGGTSGTAGGIFQTENGPQIQTRGGQYETNSIAIDGISTVSAVWGGTSIITPSEDSVDNLKVVSNSYDAENGRFSGAQIQVTSRSGTNNLHGSAFFKASRPGLNAYQRWNGVGSNMAGTPAQRGVNRDENRFNQYGGSLGGPLWKNRIFAFFNWETSPLEAAATTQNWYETPQFAASAAPAGSIAAQYLSFPGEGVSATGIVQRNCASAGLQEGVNCRTTTQGLDVGSPLRTGLGLQDLTYGGTSNNPGVGNGLDGIADLAFFNTVNPTTTSQSQYNGRVDANIGQSDRLTFTLYWVPVETTFFNGPVRPANFWHHSQVNNAFSLIWNHTFSPTLLNQARANAAGWRWNEVATNPQAPFGLPQASIDAIGSSVGATPTTPQYFGAPPPTNLNQWTYTYGDVLTKIAGRHSIKVGGELTRLYYLNNPVNAARPAFTFHNLWNFANDAPYNQTGQFDSKTGVPFANRQDMRSNLWGFFVQDDFKILPNLTINAGLRWSYFGALYSKQDNLDVFRFGPSPNVLTGLSLRVGGNLYEPQQNNWGPQLGFAWQPEALQSKFVIRGGFGINYNQNQIAITSSGTGNPPNAVQANFTCPFPFTNNPSCAGTGIVYETASNPNSLFGYAPNPNTITPFDSNNLPLTGSPILVTGFQSNPRTIANYHYSLDIQYQLPFNTVASLGYQGSQMRHLIVQNNWNAVAIARTIALNPRVNTLAFFQNSGIGSYNAMIANVRHNFSHGFQLEAIYTWAKALDENSGPFSKDPYPFDTHAAYGRSDYNVQNAFKLFGLWQPVFFHGTHSWLEKVVGGWSLSGIWNVHSGFPWDPHYNTTGIYYQGSTYNQLRPAAIRPGAGSSTDNKVFQQDTNPNFGGNASQFYIGPTYVQGAAFPATSPAPVPGISRNSLNGPGYNGVDASLTKAFGLPKVSFLGENAKFEFRADSYNLFNKTNINVSSIDSVVGSVTPDGTVTPNPAFGVAQRGLAGRTVQLQARFSF
jgi:Carboxypeptidase regulatory-like domain